MVYKLGLIGWPLEHSLSPAIHNAALHALFLRGEYHAYPIPSLPGGTGELIGLLERMRCGDIHGLNVTLPHKQTVIPWLDELTPTAAAIGAVNLIFSNGNRLVGDNTDGKGFLTDLRRFLNEIGDYHRGSRTTALVLGSGGSARAVAYALAQEGWSVTVAARRLGQARLLASELALTLSGDTAGRAAHPHPIIPIALEPVSLSHVKPDLIVNATPVGMSPGVAACPWPPDLNFPAGVVVYDLIYDPRETTLVRRARAACLPSTHGLGTLIEQAALSFERWTGLLAPQQVMRQAVDLA